MASLKRNGHEAGEVSDIHMPSNAEIGLAGGVRLGVSRKMNAQVDLTLPSTNGGLARRLALLKNDSNSFAHSGLAK